MSTIPETVVFDLGNVLLNFDYGLAASRFEPVCSLSQRELQSLIDQSPLLHRYETNLLSTEGFFAEIRAAAGFSGTFREFSEWFSDIFTPIEPMLRLHAGLRVRGIPTYLFSNTNKLAVSHIRRRYPFFRLFDGYILSCDHGSMKPDHRLYQVVEQITGRRRDQILYIDDRPENVETAAYRGWRTILHRDPVTTRTEVLQIMRWPGTGLD